MNRTGMAARAVPLLLLAALLAGCTAEDGGESLPETNLPTATEPGPEAEQDSSDDLCAPDAPHRGTFLSAARDANDFVRAVLEDCQITVAEIREVIERTNQCFAEVGADGVEMILGDTGHIGKHSVNFADVTDPEQCLPAPLDDGRRWSNTQGWDADGNSFNCYIAWSDEDIAAEDCVDEWMHEIWGLWNLITEDPHAEGRDQLVLACWQRNGLVPDGFTYEDYLELMNVPAMEAHSALWREDFTDLEFRQWQDGFPEQRRPYLPGWGYLDEGQASECMFMPREN